MNSDRIHISRYFLSCDWGTTSFRLHIVDKKNDKVVDSIIDSDGVKKINAQLPESRIESDRINHFFKILRQKITLLQKQSNIPLDNLEIAISGMASSNMGMKELPYRKLPVALDKLDLNIEFFPSSSCFPHRTYLISGLSSSNDIMRGEETQLVGLTAIQPAASGLFILPGTHSKHIIMDNGWITDFKTYMTGEVFALLAEQSVLASSIRKNKKNIISNSFSEGVEASLRENFLHTLFPIRANKILHQTSNTENYDYLSGLLIGLELQNLTEKKWDNIILSCENPLRKYYESACNCLGLNVTVVPLDEQITARGQLKILTTAINKSA